MPRLTTSNPKYRNHRASGQAVVTLDGRDFYLGPYDSAVSRREYDRLIGEWLANGRRLKGGTTDLAVVEIVAAFWRFAKDYYRGADPHSGSLASYRLALGHLKRLYGRTPAAEFGPLALKAVRQSMVEVGWSRGYVNAQTTRIRRVFKWGVSQELVPASVYHGLVTVEGLRYGRTDAPEPSPVPRVPEPHVFAVKNYVSRQVWAMIELQMVVAVAVLWAFSFFYYDAVGFWPSPARPRAYGVVSDHGTFCFISVAEGGDGARWAARHARSRMREIDSGRAGFTFNRRAGELIIGVPHWLLCLALATPAAVALTRRTADAPPATAAAAATTSAPRRGGARNVARRPPL